MSSSTPKRRVVPRWASLKTLPLGAAGAALAVPFTARLWVLTVGGNVTPWRGSRNGR
ncbi:hypothetical protein GCM10009673_26620 [Nesterenkonia sandarakina]